MQSQKRSIGRRSGPGLPARNAAATGPFRYRLPSCSSSPRLSIASALIRKVRDGTPHLPASSSAVAAPSANFSKIPIAPATKRCFAAMKPIAMRTIGSGVRSSAIFASCSGFNGPSSKFRWDPQAADGLRDVMPPRGRYHSECYLHLADASFSRPAWLSVPWTRCADQGIITPNRHRRRAVVAAAGEAYTIARGRAFRWSEQGYQPARQMPLADGLLTPPSTLLAIHVGYRPLLHPDLQANSHL